MNVYAQDAGIELTTDCLETGTCKRNIYKTLEIREDLQEQDNPFELFTQDIFLSATFFIGTLITFALVYSGLLVVTGGASESQVEKGKRGVKRSLVGLVLVIFSYTVIRGVQYIAQG